MQTNQNRIKTTKTRAHGERSDGKRHKLHTLRNWRSGR